MKSILGPTVSIISHSPHSFEVDPVRLADPFYLKANTINLTEICSNVLQKVLKMDTLDLEIKAMLERIRIITESKFPKHGRLAVTTVFFLRCFLPTFISPQIYGVNLPEGEPKGRRLFLWKQHCLQIQTQGRQLSAVRQGRFFWSQCIPFPCSQGRKGSLLLLHCEACCPIRRFL